MKAVISANNLPKKYAPVNSDLWDITESRFNDPKIASETILKAIKKYGYSIDSNENIFHSDILLKETELEIVVPLEQPDVSLYFAFSKFSDGYQVHAEVADNDDLNNILGEDLFEINSEDYISDSKYLDEDLPKFK